MKRNSLFVLFVATLLCFCSLMSSAVCKAAAKTQQYEISSFAEFETALSKANNSDVTEIDIAGELVVEKQLNLKGNIVIRGSGSAVMIFEKGESKTGFALLKNCNLSIENVTFRRTLTNETEGFLFRTSYTAEILFKDCMFDVASAEIPSISYDRITYCTAKDALKAYFENCTFDTQAYFYRGLLVFYSCDSIPQTAGSATVKDLRALKIDYETGELTFPAGMTLATDSAFMNTVKSGSKFLSETVYYVSCDSLNFQFVTKKLKMEKPLSSALDIDYSAEKLFYTDEYLVTTDEAQSKVFASGSDIMPEQVLYVSRKQQGIFQSSDVAVIRLPARPAQRLLKADFICEFGFVMEYFENMEYSVVGDWQKSPVFIGLDAGTEYKVKMRVGATKASFASLAYEITVKLS